VCRDTPWGAGGGAAAEEVDRKKQARNPTDRPASTSWRHMKSGTAELCSCSNGGALLACKVHGRGRTL
jgi:hypothetical protein